MLGGGDAPGRVDPHDPDVAEENTLFVLLVLAGAALLPPLGPLDQSWGVVLGCGTGDAGRWTQRGDVFM